MENLWFSPSFSSPLSSLFFSRSLLMLGVAVDSLVSFFSPRNGFFFSENKGLEGVWGDWKKEICWRKKSWKFSSSFARWRYKSVQQLWSEFNDSQMLSLDEMEICPNQTHFGVRGNLQSESLMTCHRHSQSRQCSHSTSLVHEAGIFNWSLLPENFGNLENHTRR